MLKLEAKLQQFLAGAQKDLPAGSTLPLDGQTVKATDIVTQLQTWIALYDKAAAAKQALAPAQQAVKAANPQVRAYLVNLTKALKVTLGAKSPLLADFGISTAAPKTPSPATKVIAKAKAAATRKARGTMGKVKRQQVTAGGSATVTVTLPAAAPAPSTTASSPAPAAPAATK